MGISQPIWREFIGEANRLTPVPTLTKLTVDQALMSSTDKPWMLERLCGKEDDRAVLRQCLQWRFRIEIFIPFF